jgi:hypothetical protein
MPVRKSRRPTSSPNRPATGAASASRSACVATVPTAALTPADASDHAESRQTADNCPREQGSRAFTSFRRIGTAPAPDRSRGMSGCSRCSKTLGLSAKCWATIDSCIWPQLLSSDGGQDSFHGGKREPGACRPIGWQLPLNAARNTRRCRRDARPPLPS